MKNVYIDDGSTGIKMAWTDDNGEVQAIMINNTFKGEHSTPNGDTPVYNYVCNGQKFSFAKLSPALVKANNVQWQYSESNAVAIQHALQVSGIPPQEITAIVSLPISEYYDHRNQLNMDNIKKKKESVMQLVTRIPESEPQFKIVDVKVLAESIPASVAKVSELEEFDSLLVVDLGGTTLDVAMIQGGTSDILQIEGNDKIGASAVTLEVLDALKRANGMSSTWFIAESIVKKRHDDAFIKARLNNPANLPIIKEALEKAIVELANSTVNFLTRFSGYSHVSVVGGGASMIADAVKAKTNVADNRFFISENPQFDLVIGMYNIGEE